MSYGFLARLLHGISRKSLVIKDLRKSDFRNPLPLKDLQLSLFFIVKKFAICSEWVYIIGIVLCNCGSLA